MVIVNSLKKAYQNRLVLDIPKLEINGNSIIGIAGNNGAGKTTFFRLLLDLIPASDGKISIDGQAVQGSDHWKSNTTAYLDINFLIPFLTPEEYFKFLFNLNEQEVNDLSSRLQPYENFFAGEIMGQKKYIRSFSAGNRDKIGIAGTLLTESKLVILDEPFAHLDPRSRVQLSELLKKYKNVHGATILLSSHDLEALSIASDRLIVLDKGKIIEDMPNKEENVQRLKLILT